MPNHITATLSSFFKAKDGHIVIWRAPNIPLWGWVVFNILSTMIRHGKLHTGFHLLAEASLFAWAYLELRSGESMFRRVLGAVVLMSITISFFK
jgi:hypothetical protein